MNFRNKLTTNSFVLRNKPGQLALYSSWLKIKRGEDPEEVNNEIGKSVELAEERVSSGSSPPSMSAKKSVREFPFGGHCLFALYFESSNEKGSTQRSLQGFPNTSQTIDMQQLYQCYFPLHTILQS